MKVVIAHRSGQAKVVDLPEPKGGRHFVTVRISHSAMRLPDELIALENAPRRVKKGEDGYPLGAFASGTIIEVGAGVQRLKAGLRVAVTGSPYVYHASQLLVPENLVVELPKKVNHEEGAYVGQGSIALHQIRMARVQLGDLVLVYGADMTGLLAAQAVRAAGAMPILVDESEYRLNKARAVGVTHAFVPTDEGLMRLVDSLSEGNGTDSALITRSGDVEAFRSATKLLRPGGILVLGAPLGTAVSLESLLEKGLALHTAFGGGDGEAEREGETKGISFPRTLVRWTERENMACFLNLLADRKIQIAPLITDRIPLERAAIAYEKAQRGRDAVLGVVLTV